MLTADFFYEAPASLDGVMNALATRDKVSLLAGGTDLIPLIKQGVKKPSCLIDLKNVPSLKTITRTENGLLIGSMVTLAAIAGDRLVNRYCPALAQSARAAASPQIRNVATLAGNLLQERRCLYFNQSEYWRKGVPACLKVGGDVCLQAPKSQTCRALYYSDAAPTLLAFDARAEIYDRGNFEVVSLQDVIHRHTTGKNDKLLLTGILLPLPPEGTWGKFMKQGVRAAIDFATVNVALRFSPALESQRPAVKIFVGAISPEPVELNETAEFLIANYSKRSSLQGEIEARAKKEANAKAALIRETGISLKSKRNGFNLASNILSELFKFLAAA